MIPIRDHNPSGRRPYVTYALMAINLVVFLSYVPLFDDPRALFGFYRDWALIPAVVTQTGDRSGLFTSMFLHGGWMHLAGNMLFLFIFGDNLEDEMGHVLFLAFYIAAGIGAGLLHVMSAPMSLVPTVGASGAIAGVMGGYLLLYPKAKVDILFFIFFFVKIFAIPAWLMLTIWFSMQIFGGMGADPEMGGVAYWAHAGGFIVGALLTVPFWLRRGGARFWRRHEGHPPHPEAEYEYSASRIPKVRRRR